MFEPLLLHSDDRFYWQFIYSDHYDLIGLQCYGGHAPGFLAWLEVKGLAVNADPDILLPPAQRSKGKRTQKWIDVSANLTLS